MGVAASQDALVRAGHREQRLAIDRQMQLVGGAHALRGAGGEHHGGDTWIRFSQVRGLRRRRILALAVRISIETLALPGGHFPTAPIVALLSVAPRRKRFTSVPDL